MNERISAQLHIFAVILLCSIHKSAQIRVHFNTNTGPIVPPTVTPRPVPQPPFRDPAPVWEDQTGDIPNPNPYQYVPPPPSRPRYNNYYGDFEVTNSIDDTNRRYDVFAPQPYDLAPQPPVQSRVIGYPQQFQPRHTNTATVPSLSVQYIPNVGWRYFAVVPLQNQQYYGQLQQPYAQSSNRYEKYAYEHEKTSGKYNPKLKTYKVYEKNEKKFSGKVSPTGVNKHQQPSTAQTTSTAPSHVNSSTSPSSVAVSESSTTIKN